MLWCIWKGLNMDSNYENDIKKENIKSPETSYKALLIFSIILNFTLIGWCVYGTYHVNSLETKAKEQVKSNKNRIGSIRTQIKSIREAVDSLDSEFTRMEKDSKDKSAEIKTEKKGIN